ncbi:unnamed protein product [Strongylus vulgaris]|uniref:Plasma membrane calcium transporting P-type ATPase C-terminal domain-containing protein n=1 Tax=Strongylus vulgaris TaxID=40348 RepID=A0A3P7KB00_STRVU|nr:unnamed protein product [Strongylus vulgaris]
MTIGSGEAPANDPLMPDYEDPDTHEKRSGQILWVRGLTRLQTQLIKAVIATKVHIWQWIENMNLMKKTYHKAEEKPADTPLFCIYIALTMSSTTNLDKT